MFRKIMHAGLVLFAVGFLWARPCLGEMQGKLGDEINQNQPIAIGETIYDMYISGTNVDVAYPFYLTHGRKYTYTGIEGNNIKVTCVESSSDSNDEKGTTESNELLLPLVNKKAILKTPGYNCPDEWGCSDALPPKELQIEIADDQNRVTVRDLGGPSAGPVVQGAAAEQPMQPDQAGQQQPEVVNNDPLAVSGILSGSKPVAVIGGQMHQEGDIVNDYKIKSIGSNYVDLLDKDNHTIREYVGGPG